MTSENLNVVLSCKSKHIIKKKKDCFDQLDNFETTHYCYCPITFCFTLNSLLSTYFCYVLNSLLSTYSCYVLSSLLSTYSCFVLSSLLSTYSCYVLSSLLSTYSCYVLSSLLSTYFCYVLSSYTGSPISLGSWPPSLPLGMSQTRYL